MKKITATQLKNILDQHQLWIQTNGKQGNCADLTGANLTITHFQNASLDSIIGLPDVSWIIPGCLVRLYKFRQHFFVTKEDKYENFVQDSFGFFIQNNLTEKTFDMLVEDRIIRNIPDWVKYSGLKQIASESD